MTFSGREDPHRWFSHRIRRKLCAAYNSWNFSKCWCRERRTICSSSLCYEISGTFSRRGFSSLIGWAASVYVPYHISATAILTWFLNFCLQTLKEAIEINNSVPQGLSSSMFTHKPEVIFKWIGWVFLPYLVDTRFSLFLFGRNHEKVVLLTYFSPNSVFSL